MIFGIGVQTYEVLTLHITITYHITLIINLKVWYWSRKKKKSHLFDYSLYLPPNRYRLGLSCSLWHEFKYMFMFLVFFSGLGWHVMIAMPKHLIGV